MALICHTVGSKPFRSPIISYCAIYSRERIKKSGDSARRRKMEKEKGTSNDEEDETARRRRELGSWKVPGNYSSHLSAMIWTAQLVIFESVCFKVTDREDDVLAALAQVCRKYMHQAGETAFGHILQWRLYLSAAARSAISRDQARWSWDGKEITYLGTTLHMDHVPQLIVSEFRRARTLLFDELLFGATDIAPIEAWRLQDDLDVEDYGGSWLTDDRNVEILAGSQEALLRQIESRADLRRVFLQDIKAAEVDKGRVEGGRKKRLCRQAMAVYEAYI